MQNKRQFPRFTVEGIHGRMVFASQVEVLNLSLGGVAIRADRRLNIGAEYTLKLEVGDRIVAVRGLVVWSVLSGIRKVKGENVPQYSAGLKFTDVLTDKLQALIEFIDENKISEEHRLGGIRFQINAPGKAVLDSLESYRVRLISHSGMLIETERRFEVDRLYDMELQIPDREAIKFSGRVASCGEMEDEVPKRYKVGIEFKDMAAGDHERLQEFVESVARR